jgi:hypothetical protein
LFLYLRRKAVLQQCVAHIPDWKVLFIFGFGALFGVAPGIMLGRARQEKYDKWFYKLDPDAKRPWGV